MRAIMDHPHEPNGSNVVLSNPAGFFNCCTIGQQKNLRISRGLDLFPVMEVEIKRFAGRGNNLFPVYTYLLAYINKMLPSCTVGRLKDSNYLFFHGHNSDYE